MTVKTFDALRFTDDTPDVAYSPYLAAFGRPEIIEAALGAKPLYATADEILTAMLQVRGTSDTNLPLALGEDPDSPELFLASLSPYGLDLLNGERALWLHLDNSAGNLGNLKVRGEVRPDTILDGELSDLPYRGHYRIARYVESDGDEATIAGGATVKTRLPFGSFVLVERVAQEVG